MSAQASDVVSLDPSIDYSKLPGYEPDPVSSAPVNLNPNIDYSKLPGYEPDIPAKTTPSWADTLGELADESPLNPLNIYKFATHIGQNIPALGPAALSLADKSADYIKSLVGRHGSKELANDVASSSGLNPINPNPFESALIGTNPDLNEADKSNIQQAGEFAKENPITNTAATVAGGAMLPTLGQLGAVSEVADNAPLLAKGANYLYNAGTRIGYGTGLTAADAAVRGQDPNQAGNFATKVGLGLEGAGIGVKGLGKFIPRYMFGVLPETEVYYRANPEAVNSASEGDAANQLAQNAEALRDQTDAAQMGATQAQADQAVAASQVKQNLKEETQGAYQDAKDAQEQASNAGQLLKESLKATPTPDIYNDILDSTQALRSTISETSSKAFDVLQDAGTPINIVPLKGYVTQAMNSLKIEGAEPILNGAQDYSKLAALRGYLDNFGQEISPDGMKQVIQMLDGESGPIYDKLKVGQYASRGERALLDIRSFANDSLMDIPEYKEIMAPMSGYMNLVKQANSLVTNPKSVRMVLQQIGKGTAPEAEATINQLGQTTGNDLLAPMKAYQQAQTTLQNPSQMQAAVDALPESLNADQKQQIYEAIKAKNTNPQTANEAIQNLPETEALNEAQSNLGSAKAYSNEFTNITPQNSQNIIRQLYSPRRANDYVTQQVGALDELSGTDIIGQAKNVGVQHAFEKGFVNGSRNVNLGAFSLGGILGSIAKPLGHLGQAAGAIGGAVADLSGPSMYKKIIDFSMSPGGQQFRSIFAAAAERGPQAVAVTHYILGQTDPTYQKLFENGANQ